MKTSRCCLLFTAAVALIFLSSCRTVSQGPKPVLEKAQPVNALGATPLHEAARNGHLETARVLLDRGADVNARDSRGLTPLHYAASNGHLDTARMLVKMGAKAEAEDKGGITPVHLAAAMGHPAMVEFLIRAANEKPAQAESPEPAESDSSGRIASATRP